MRVFLNEILAFISAESLTDVEFASIGSLDYGYNQATYSALAEIVADRESISSVGERLLAYFTAKGVSVTPYDTGRSNIFIGAVLN